MDNSNPGQHWQSAASFVSSSFTSMIQIPMHRRHRLAVAVVLAMGGSWAGSVAADSCSGRHTVIGTAVTTACRLGDGERVTLTTEGSLSVASGAAVAQEGVVNRQAGFLNAGSVQGEQGMVIRGGAFVGKWLNDRQGSIIGSDAALVIERSEVMGQVRNLGTLAATGTDSYAVRTDDANLDGFNNSGTIEARNGAEGAVLMRDTVIIGDLRNSGLVGGDSASDGLIFRGGQILGSFLNSGRLEGGSTPLGITDVLVLGDVRNSGDITSNDGGASISNSHILGRFVNSGYIGSNITAFWIGNTIIEGGFVNTGVIDSGSSTGITNSVLGSFINNGILKSGSGDTSLSDTLIKGDLINRGTIATGRTGFNGLTVYGGSIAGNLINRGTLDGGHFASGLSLDRGAVIVGDLRNQGLAQGRTAIELNGAHILGDLVNSGSLLGAIDLYEDNGTGLLANGGDIGGSLVNSGLIKGFDAGVRLTGVKVAGDIFNTGTLIGTDGGGLSLENTRVQRVENRGLIQGDYTAVSIGSGSQVSELAAYGTLSGFEYALFVDDESTLGTLTIGGTQARFEGEVYAPRTKAYINSNARYHMAGGDSFVVKSLYNRGTLVLDAPEAGLQAARVNGDYTQASGALLQTTVGSAQNYGQLLVSGTATLASNARIDVKLLNTGTPFNVNSLADVLSAGKLVSDGTFKVTSNSALFDVSAVKHGNTVDLALAAKSANGVASAARSAGLKQAAGAAAVLDQQLALGAASALTPYFVSASSQAEVATTLAQSVPMDNDALRTSQAALSAIGQAVQGRMSLASPGNASAGLWRQAFSYSGSGANGSGSAGGSVIGMDTALSSTHRLGVAFAYADGSTGSLGGSRQRDQFDLWQFLGYSTHRLDANTEWMLYGGAGNNRVDAERTLSTGAASGTAHARYDSLVTTVGSSLAQTYRLGDSTTLVPSLRLDFNHVHEGSYRERGTSSLQPLLLKVAARDTEQLIAGFDTRLEHQIAPGTRVRANLGIGYDLINADGSLRAAFAGAAEQTFTVTPERASPWLMRGGVGVASTFTNGSELSLNWDAQNRSDYTDQTATLSMKVPF
ncbi:autotransporter family protein [Pseudomonas massiliensis]|uniref:autotransporter family protein n=1 Tax=Pseudomonas massiliensis TaxID=522492 RepID=UPI00058AD291|nr:autotransporter outer membrane beta-barrel domain-containing protein [Pseudomonas massiliensis]